MTLPNSALMLRATRYEQALLELLSPQVETLSEARGIAADALSRYGIARLEADIEDEREAA